MSSFVSCGEALATLQATGRPWRSAIAMILLPFLGESGRQQSPFFRRTKAGVDSTFVADTLAWAYCHKGAYGLAADLLLDAVKKAPQNATNPYHLGLAYQKMNNRAQAKLYLERALNADPRASHAHEIRRALAELPN